MVNDAEYRLRLACFRSFSNIDLENMHVLWQVRTVRVCAKKFLYKMCEVKVGFSSWKNTLAEYRNIGRVPEGQGCT